MDQIADTRSRVLKNLGIRVLAGMYAIVVILVFGTVIALIWVMWFILQQLGKLYGNTWAFENSAGHFLSNNLYSWVTHNIRVALWGSGGRMTGVQWLPSNRFGGQL